MTETVTLYHNPMSRARIVQWMLEEIGAPYELKHVDLKNGEQKAEAYLKINPMGKVPAIVHRGVVVTEAAAICAYLADAFPHAKLAPALDDPARGTYLRWFFFAASCVEPAILEKKFPRSEKPHPGWLGFGTYENVINTLEGAVSQGFILGDRFSAADVYIASQIGWALMQNDIEPRENFTAYHQRCTARAAYKRMMSNHASEAR